MSSLILEVGQFAVDTAGPIGNRRHMIQWVGDAVLDVGFGSNCCVGDWETIRYTTQHPRYEDGLAGWRYLKIPAVSFENRIGKYYFARISAQEVLVVVFFPSLIY